MDELLNMRLVSADAVKEIICKYENRRIQNKMIFEIEKLPGCIATREQIVEWLKKPAEFPVILPGHGSGEQGGDIEDMPDAYDVNRAMNCDGCINDNTDECMHCMRAYSDCYEKIRL